MPRTGLKELQLRQPPQQREPVACECVGVEVVLREALRAPRHGTCLVVVRPCPLERLQHVLGALLPHGHIVLARLEQVVVECMVARLLLENNRVHHQQLLQARAARLAVQVQQVLVACVVDHLDARLACDVDWHLVELALPARPVHEVHSHIA
eukprot:363718-Chlamydomonas_euryale.AAC.3